MTAWCALSQIRKTAVFLEKNPCDYRGVCYHGDAEVKCCYDSPLLKPNIVTPTVKTGIDSLGLIKG